MAGLLIMLPIALLIAGVFLYFFFWSVKNGDYEDSEMMKYKMIFDDQDDVDRSIASPDSSVVSSLEKKGIA